MGKQNPVLVWMSLLAALQVFFAGTTGVSIINDNEMLAGIMAVGMLAVAAAQVGVQFYVRGQVVPTADVLEYQTGGEVFAGPANEIVKPFTQVRVKTDPNAQDLPLTEMDGPEA